MTKEEDIEDEKLTAFISDLVRKHYPDDVESFLEGVLYGCQAFAGWKDGTQYLGSEGLSYKVLKISIDKYWERRR